MTIYWYVNANHDSSNNIIKSIREKYPDSFTLHYGDPGPGLFEDMRPYVRWTLYRGNANIIIDHFTKIRKPRRATLQKWTSGEFKDGDKCINPENWIIISNSLPELTYPNSKEMTDSFIVIYRI